MKIYDFTMPELEYFKQTCNFTPEEYELFSLRSKGVQLEECAEIMHCDSIKKLSGRVNKKIIKMTNTKWMNDWIDNVYWKSILEKP